MKASDAKKMTYEAKEKAAQQAEEEREREELVHECSLQSVAGTLPCDVRAGGSWVLTQNGVEPRFPGMERSRFDTVFTLN